ncbi:MAG: hypothetical protein IPP79_14465 [Chitinophagaceae bacterium]|nr:hypothetical protein [Chitinophagaceae bacterium]
MFIFLRSNSKLPIWGVPSTSFFILKEYFSRTVVDLYQEFSKVSTVIVWKSIRPFKGSQNKGFEQLCFQLAMRLHGTEGYFTEVDDTGGGDGVEFYQRRKNAKEWGWQAKFYDGSVRLNLSGRKRKIIESLSVLSRITRRLNGGSCAPIHSSRRKNKSGSILN